MSNSLTFLRSTFHHNEAGLDGGGLYVEVDDFAAAINSTISHNSAKGWGGGVFDAPGTLRLGHPTVTKHEADAVGARGGAGGGIFNDSLDDHLLVNTIVAGNLINASGFGTDTDLGGDYVGEFNLIGNGDGSSGLIDGVDGNQVGTTGGEIDARLRPLAYGANTTATHGLRRRSPAIDQGNNFFPFFPFATATDQRGGPRTINQGGIANAGDGTDVGAVELRRRR